MVSGVGKVWLLPGIVGIIVMFSGNHSAVVASLVVLILPGPVLLIMAHLANRRTTADVLESISQTIKLAGIDGKDLAVDPAMRVSKDPKNNSAGQFHDGDPCWISPPKKRATIGPHFLRVGAMTQMYGSFKTDNQSDGKLHQGTILKHIHGWKLWLVKNDQGKLEALPGRRLRKA